MQTPFFKKELDQDNIKKLSELETKIEQEKAKKKKMVANIIKFDEELADARDELSNLKKDKLFYSGELRKLNQYNDPNGLSVDQIKSRLQKEDPSLFRQIMSDLNYIGEDPAYERMEMLDQIASGVGDDASQKLKEQFNRLKKAKTELASELERVQNVLKQDVDIDKQNQMMTENEITATKARIERDKQEMAQYQKLYQARAVQIEELKRKLPASQLTSDNLAKLGIYSKANIADDAMTEFSVLTTESEIQP